MKWHPYSHYKGTAISAILWLCKATWFWTKPCIITLELFFTLVSEKCELIYQGSSNNDYMLLLCSLFCSMVARNQQVTPMLSKDLDGCYTQPLRMVFSVNLKQHMTNKELYGSLPKVSAKIRDRRLHLAGHCCTEELISRLLLWRTKHGKRKAGRLAITYTDLLQQDTGLETPEIRTAMLSRIVWRAIIVWVQVST